MVTPPTIEVANLGMADSLILMVLALVVFGPRRLPQIGKQIGKLMYEFRKASNDFKFQMEEELRNAEDADRRKREDEERQRKLALTAPSSSSETVVPPTEAVTEAHTVDAPTPSSYSGETTDPAPPAQETPAETIPAEESYPSIKPPSTGETVAAARPGPPAGEELEPTQDESAGVRNDVTEQATHNG